MPNLPAVHSFYSARTDDSMFIVTFYAFLVGMCLPIIVPAWLCYKAYKAVVVFAKNKGA